MNDLFFPMKLNIKNFSREVLQTRQITIVHVSTIIFDSVLPISRVAGNPGERGCAELTRAHSRLNTRLVENRAST